jgi:hypothetical protein
VSLASSLANIKDRTATWGERFAKDSQHPIALSKFREGRIDMPGADGGNSSQNLVIANPRADESNARFSPAWCHGDGNDLAGTP